MDELTIRDVTAQPGEKRSGYLESSRTASQIPIHIPFTIVRGASDGPTLLVSSAVHGNEITGTIALGQILRELDPKDLAGTLLAVPVVNTSAFEFDSRVTYWDGQMLSIRNPGSLEGSISEQLAWMYINELAVHADAVIDIHSGRQIMHVWHSLIEENIDPDITEKSLQMAMAFGLSQILKNPVGKAANSPGNWDKPFLLPEVGGGPDFLQNGHHQIATCRRGITNVMKLMGMLEGEIKTEADEVEILTNVTSVYSGTNAGIMLWACQPGDDLKKGDVFAHVYHPFTGEQIGAIRAPVDGTVVNTGTFWPVIHQGDWLVYLADRQETLPIRFTDIW